MQRIIYTSLLTFLIIFNSQAQQDNLVLSNVSAKSVLQKEENHYFIDFGKAWFGTIQLIIPNNQQNGSIEVRLGEKSVNGNAVDLNPGGTIRSFKGNITLEKGKDKYLLQLPDYMPPSWGKDYFVALPDSIPNVLPFRYCEVIGLEHSLSKKDIILKALHIAFNDEASSFECSDTILNQVWEMCKHSMKATSFCGLYVDGDRERRPYEADAYINQLSHYGVDAEYELARQTLIYFFDNPTWPTEWQSHTIFMAYQDYMYTGNTDILNEYYEDLKHRALTLFAREDGLISTHNEAVNITMQELLNFPKGVIIKDLVDWPPSERDSFELMEYNTVVNAFYYKAVCQMQAIATILGMRKEAESWEIRAKSVKESFHKAFFNPSTGLYVDGEESIHSSLHANAIPLAFGLVPQEHKQKIIEFVKSKGMACSVYAAQYLLEALYQEGEDEYALSLMTSTDIRSWWNMIAVGSTVTLEAWDAKYKPNLDWNHAWGAAPGNIIPRHLFGIVPLKPGFSTFQIKPQLGTLFFAHISTPCPQGIIKCNIKKKEDSVVMDVSIPENTTAVVYLPTYGSKAKYVMVNSKQTKAENVGDYVKLKLTEGTYSLIY